MPQYCLGNLTFSTKTEATKFISNYLASATPNQKIEDGDKHWIIDLFSKHPRYAEKIYASIKEIYVKQTMGSKCFFIVVDDGCETDISYKKCLAGKENKKQLAISALRYSIWDQICEFKRSVFKTLEPVYCPVTNILLKKNRLTHIDHYYDVLTFQQLVENFCKENSIVLDEVETMSFGTTRHLRDKEMEKKFQDYHKKNAVLRAISWEANIRGKD